MPTRRDFLRLALGTAATISASSLGCTPRREKPAQRMEPASRYWVLVLLSGGHDTLYTTDPKTRDAVDDLVTLPTANDIATGGNLVFGPHFARLSRWSSALSIVNGVQVRTANHDTGQKQFFRLKTNIGDGVPSVLDIIASHRQHQPLGVAYINMSQRSMHTPAYFGTADKFYFGDGDIFDQVAKAEPKQLATLATVLRKNARDISVTGPNWREAEQTATYLGEVADFFEKVADVPPLVSAQRSTDYVIQTMAESFDRALWLIENDLTSGVVLDLGLLGWDSHIRNEAKQAEMNTAFVTFFDDYLAQLHTRKTAHGLLSQRTTTVVGSELGRYPHQNDMLGKDHLPQTSFLFAGPNIRTNHVFGRTGRRMDGLAIDYATGAPADAGRLPLLDDIGTTLLHLAHLDPERYGYSGRVCDFLVDRV